MQFEHPTAVRGESVDIAGELYRVDDESGIFEVPEEAATSVRAWAESNGYDYEDILVEESNSAESEPDESDDDGGEDEEEDSEDLESLSHSELKDLARDLGIAEDTDLRSRDSVISAIQAYREEE